MLSAVLNSATGEIRPDSNVVGIPWLTPVS
jgi:hypothetical protein